MAKKKIKVLFFIAGVRATEDEEAEMLEFNNRHQICIRNASMIHDGDAIEDFDKVAGCVPDAYLEAAAEKKPEPEAPKPPKVDAKKVDKQSPAAPKPETKDDKTPKSDEDAKPKQPEAKPGAGAGWKPNA